MLRNLGAFVAGVLVIGLLVAMMNAYRSAPDVERITDFRMKLDGEEIPSEKKLHYKRDSYGTILIEIDGERYAGKAVAFALTTNEHIKAWVGGKLVLNYTISEKGNLNPWHRYFALFVDGDVVIEGKFKTLGGLEKDIYVGAPEEITRFVERANTIEEFLFHLGTGFMGAILILSLLLGLGVRKSEFIYGGLAAASPILTSLDEMHLVLIPILLWKKMAILGAALAIFFSFIFVKKILGKELLMFEKIYFALYWLLFSFVIFARDLYTVRGHYSNFYLFSLLALFYISFLLVRHSRTFVQRFVTAGLGSVLGSSILSILSVVGVFKLDFMFFNIGQLAYGLTIATYVMLRTVDVYKETLAMNEAISNLMEQQTDYIRKLTSWRDAILSLSERTQEDVRKVEHVSEELEKSSGESLTRLLELSKNLQFLEGFVDKLLQNNHVVRQTLREAEELNKNIVTLSSENKATLAKSVDILNTLKAENELLSSLFAKLTESISNIRNVTSKIKDIAKETNLLSLNASIESARAGESGKSFAVVALEIRNLSNDTSSLAESIEKDLAKLFSDFEAFSSQLLDLFQKLEQVVSQNASVMSAMSTFTDSVEEMTEKFENLIESIENQQDELQEFSEKFEKLLQLDEVLRSSFQIVERSKNEVLDVFDEIKKKVEEIQGSMSV